MQSATAVAHANLAFVKYWGKLDATLNIPLNNSISMNLSAAQTTTTVTFIPDAEEDAVLVGDVPASAQFATRTSRHLDRIRQLAGVTTMARVETRNTFPASTGVASSASGLAALTVATTAALGLRLSERDLSILARQGSGSACRSIPAGFAEWHAGTRNEDSYAVELAPPDHWDIVDVAVVVTQEAKKVSSSDGHLLALQSPFWNARSEALPARLDKVRTAILERDFVTFGQQIETEAMSMHAIMLTSAHTADGVWQSGIYYWTPDTLLLLMAVQRWRAEGLPVYFTLDAGPTVHLICPAQHQPAVVEAVRIFEQAHASSGPWSVMVSHPAPGAHIITD